MAENVTGNQGDIYVRKDVFDARMDRMEMLLEKTTVEIKSYVDKAMGELRNEVKTATGSIRDELKTETASIRNELKAETASIRDELKTETGGLRNEIGGLRTEISELRSDVKVLTARVDSLEHTVYWWIGVFGLILASAVILPPIIGFFKKIFQPSVTIEEIQRLIDTAITTRLSGGESK